MYRKGSQGWIKHYDFVLFDLFALQFAYLIAYFIRNGAGNPYGIPLYRNMAVAIELADIAVLFFFETLKNVLKRGYYRELAVTVKHVVLVELIAVLYLFTIQAGQQFSRSVLYLTGVFYGIITYLVRMLWKTFLQKKMLAGGSRSLLIVTTKDIASTVIRNIKEHNFEMFSIAGLVIIDEDMTGKNVCGMDDSDKDAFTLEDAEDMVEDQIRMDKEAGREPLAYDPQFFYDTIVELMEQDEE